MIPCGRVGSGLLNPVIFKSCGIDFFPLFTRAISAADWAMAERLEDTLYILDHLAIQYAKDRSDPVALFDRKLFTGPAKLDYAAGGSG